MDLHNLVVLGGIGRFNVSRGGPAAFTLLQLQEHGRRILKLVNDTICKRAKANRHVVFVEQPSGSSWLEEPELEGVRALIQSGDLIVIKAHRCQHGYEDADSGLPHFKPSTYM